MADRPPVPATEHSWFDPATRYPRLARRTPDGEPLESCRSCGVNKGAVSQTRPCPGPARITLR